MSMIALACALSYWLVHKTVWMWWILVIFGGLSTAVLVIHHLYMATVMIVYVHVALNEVVVAYNRSRPSRLKGALHALIELTHAASAKIHAAALALTHNEKHTTAPWRPSLYPREWNKDDSLGHVPAPAPYHKGASILRRFL